MDQEKAFLFFVFFLPLFAVGLSIAGLIVCCCIRCISRCGELGRETEERNAAAQRVAATTLPAAAAPVVKKELGNFPYAGAVEESDSEQRVLVCPICLEAFVRGAACSEVPACRHVFHRDCIGAWMKKGRRTCPLCRALIVQGSESERLSSLDAEDMV